MFSTCKLRNIVTKHCLVLNEVTVYSFSIRQSVESTAQNAVYFYCCVKISLYKQTGYNTCLWESICTFRVYFDRNLSFFTHF